MKIISTNLHTGGKLAFPVSSISSFRKDDDKPGLLITLNSGLEVRITSLTFEKLCSLMEDS